MKGRNSNPFAEGLKVTREDAYATLRKRAEAKGFTSGDTLSHKFFRGLFSFIGIAESGYMIIESQDKPGVCQSAHPNDLSK
ncbi:MAG: hypothetical protein Greene07147_452 [Parcubacteria group bacterium Greene0714_7]|nr:MAG: hypothetical protein Greene07147_452 [Parcubacteria group bacterium Greene0714_7]